MRCADRSAMRRPPHRGQNPRPLHEKATRRSSPQAVHRKRASPGVGRLTRSCTSTSAPTVPYTVTRRVRGYLERQRLGDEASAAVGAKAPVACPRWRGHPHHSVDARPRERPADTALSERDRRGAAEGVGDQLEAADAEGRPRLESLTACHTCVTRGSKNWRALPAFAFGYGETGRRSRRSSR